MHDMDLGKMTLMKHSMRMMDNTQFKEHYRPIPQSLYEEMHDHLKEMLGIGATQLSGISMDQSSHISMKERWETLILY